MNRAKLRKVERPALIFRSAAMFPHAAYLVQRRNALGDRPYGRQRVRILESCEVRFEMEGKGEIR
jgi:hypothetical protein